MAKYKNRTVKLNKPSRGDVKKFKVFVKNSKTGRVVKVNFGDKKLSIKKNIPARKRSFMARFRPILAKAKRSGKQLNTTPVYWAVKSWQKGFKTMIDQFFYRLFGMIDNCMGYLFDRFISDAPKKKKKK